MVRRRTRLEQMIGSPSHRHQRSIRVRHTRVGYVFKLVLTGRRKDVWATIVAYPHALVALLFV